MSFAVSVHLYTIKEACAILLRLESTTKLFDLDGLHRAIIRLSVEGDLDLQVIVIELVGQSIAIRHHGLGQLVSRDRFIHQATVLVNLKSNPCTSLTDLGRFKSNLHMIRIINRTKNIC